MRHESARKDQTHFGKARVFRVVEVVHAVPDTLQDPVDISQPHARLMHACTHEANGVTPIPAPTSKTVSYFRKSSLALPKGPSTMTRGKILLIAGFVLVPTTFPPAGRPFSPFSGLLSKSHPTALASADVKSPTTRIWTEM